jgi:hypothetical protein
MAAHGVAKVSGYFAELRRYELTGVAGQISCPTLVVECEGDLVGGGGPELVRMLRAPSSLVTLTEAQGASGHCGGLGQRGARRCDLQLGRRSPRRAFADLGVAPVRCPVGGILKGCGATVLDVSSCASITSGST